MAFEVLKNFDTRVPLNITTAEWEKSMITSVKQIKSKKKKFGNKIHTKTKKKFGHEYTFPNFNLLNRFLVYFDPLRKFLQKKKKKKSKKNESSKQNNFDFFLSSKFFPMIKLSLSNNSNQISKHFT